MLQKKWCGIQAALLVLLNKSILFYLYNLELISLSSLYQVCAFAKCLTIEFKRNDCLHPSPQRKIITVFFPGAPVL